MNWLRQALTGPDNQTVAIGRLIAFAITIALLMILPFCAYADIFFGSHDKERITAASDAWHSFFEALAVYVSSTTVSMTALIRVTNSTEPPARGDDDKGQIQ